MGTQVYTIEELRNMISEEDFEKIYETIEEKVELRINFTEEDMKKRLEEQENIRKQKLEEAMKKLKINADRNLFAGGIIEISIDSIDYKTSANPAPPKPINPGNNRKQANVKEVEEDKEFIWPDLNNNIYNENGKCYGLKNHIGILVDGTVIPCCLDCNAKINLGNIFDDSLENILKQEKVLKMIKGFQENKKVEELCKHCNFINK